MKINLFHNSKLKIDLGRILNKNLLENRFIRLIYKFTNSITKINSKV